MTMFAVSTRKEENSPRGNTAALPATITTARVSPIARPIAGTNDARMPEFVTIIEHSAFPEYHRKVLLL